MTFNDSMRIMASAAFVCLALFVGAYGWTRAYELRQERYAHTAFVEGRHREGIERYRNLSEEGKKRMHLTQLAEDACAELGLSKEALKGGVSWGCIGWIGAACSAIIFALIVSLRKQESAKCVETTPMATPAQIAMIRKLSHWQSTVGLTQEAASALITSLMERATAQPCSAQTIDPYRFMTPSQARRARERAEKAQAREERDREREHLREERAKEQLFKKREAEQERLYKLRDAIQAGDTIRKSGKEKIRVIQDFQSLMLGILADNRIEPQEVRQIKAWLVEHSQYPNEFRKAISLFDDALKDGVISDVEQSLIFEAVLDCLITLRARK